MNKKILILLFVFITSVASEQLFAADSTADRDTIAFEKAQLLRAHLQNLSSLSFVFNQRTIGQLAGRSRDASGKAYFIREGEDSKMRWNYISPDRQVILNDGKTLTMYFEKLNQMIIAPAETLQDDITYLFFSSEGKIEENFVVTSGDPSGNTSSEPQNHIIIQLEPRSPTSQIKTIRLWVSEINEIKRIEIRDSFDTLTLLTLSNTEENSLTADGIAIQPDLFKFTPPQGTEIIRQ